MVFVNIWHLDSSRQGRGAFSPQIHLWENKYPIPSPIPSRRGRDAVKSGKKLLFCKKRSVGNCAEGSSDLFKSFTSFVPKSLKSCKILTDIQKIHVKFKLRPKKYYPEQQLGLKLNQIPSCQMHAFLYVPLRKRNNNILNTFMNQNIQRKRAKNVFYRSQLFANLLNFP